MVSGCIANANFFPYIAVLSAKIETNINRWKATTDLRLPRDAESSSWLCSLSVHTRSQHNFFASNFTIALSSYSCKTILFALESTVVVVQVSASVRPSSVVVVPTHDAIATKAGMGLIAPQLRALLVLLQQCRSHLIPLRL